MADEELWYSREVVDVLKDNIVKFTCVIFQVQDVGEYPRGIDETPMPLTSVSSPFYRGCTVCRAKSRG